MESAEGPVGKSKRAVRREAADQVRLVFDHGAIALLAFGGGLLSDPAFRGGGGEQHVGHCQDTNVAADEHETLVFGVGEERSAAFKKRIDAEGCDQQGAGGGASLAEAKRGPDQEREGQISERVILDAIYEPRVEGNECSGD